MGKEKKRVLFVSRNFPPTEGGMERLNYHSYLALRTIYDVALCGPSGAKGYLEPGDPPVSA